MPTSSLFPFYSKLTNSGIPRKSLKKMKSYTNSDDCFFTAVSPLTGFIYEGYAAESKYIVGSILCPRYSSRPNEAALLKFS